MGRVGAEGKGVGVLLRVVVAGELLRDVAIFTVLQFNNDEGVVAIDGEEIADFAVDGVLATQRDEIEQIGEMTPNCFF